MKSGILNVYKESGYTSFDVVAKLRGILHIKKIGHTGTLDPMATGVLVVCIGKATKLVEQLSDHDKQYETKMLLGTETDTQDLTGNVISKSEGQVTKEDIRAAAALYVGEIQQIPPMYSAIKVNGKKLYELARKGIEVERKARTVEIYAIEIVKIQLPEVTMRVSCSKGTYIRTLCSDIGKKLGCGACMKSLERLQVGEFSLDHAYTLDEIQKRADENRLEEILLPVERFFEKLPAYQSRNEDTDKILINGGAVEENQLLLIPEEKDGVTEKMTSVRVYLTDKTFVGTYQKKENRFCLKQMFLENGQ